MTLAGRPLAVWFEFAGLLFALTALAIVAMPFSGGWLLLPAAIGLLLKKRNDVANVAVRPAAGSDVKRHLEQRSRR